MWAQALGRAPAGSVPARRATKGEAAAAAAQIQLGCDIERSTAQLLQLLFEVHSCKLLLDPMVVANAVRRYETCWLPLVAAHAATRARSVIAPPLDVAWVWLLHALDPVHYAEDMARVLSKAVMRWWPDEMVPQNRPSAAVAEARRLWEAAQLYEPFDITQQVALKYGAMKAYLEKFGHESQLGTDFEAASAALADFMYQVALPHYREGWFLARAAMRYRRFLHLHRLHGRTTLIPPPDIDLCWRTHQVSHVAYSADSMSLFGDIYLRDDEQLNWKPGMLEFNFHLTEELYRAAYGEPLSADGSMFRGTPPPLWRTDPNPGEPAWEGAPCNAEHGAFTTAMGTPAWAFTLSEGAPILDTWPPLPEDGVLIVVRASRGGPYHRAMSLVMHYSGATFDTASVMVLDPEGTVFATGQLVGSEQLPVRALAGGRDGAGPALAGIPGERAFSIAGRERDWGIAVATPRPGDPARPLIGDDKKDAKAGGMHIRLFRRGASDGSSTPFRWTRSNLPDNAGMLWELLHGTAKTNLLGKTKRPPTHPCDVSITIGPQGIPTRVICGPAEDCGVALALAGTLALQRTILTLQGVGGLLRTFSASEASTPRSPEGFKLLSEEQLFHSARARMHFPSSRRSTPQRPSRAGSVVSSAPSSPTRPVPQYAGYERQQQARDPPLSPSSRSVASSFGFSSAVAPSIAMPPTTPGRHIEAPPPPTAAASTIVAGIRANEWGAMGVPLAAVEVLGSEDAAVLAFLEALRTGADDSEIAVRRHALLTKAAPELNPGLNPGLNPMSDMSSPRRRPTSGDGSTSSAATASPVRLGPPMPELPPPAAQQQRQQAEQQQQQAEQQQQQQPPTQQLSAAAAAAASFATASSQLTKQRAAAEAVQRDEAAAAAALAAAGSAPGAATANSRRRQQQPDAQEQTRRSLSFDTGRRSDDSVVLKPLTAAPGNDQPPGSQEYVLRRGGDGTRLSPRDRLSPRGNVSPRNLSPRAAAAAAGTADSARQLHDGGGGATLSPASPRGPGITASVPRSPRAVALAAETAKALERAAASEAAFRHAEPSAHRHSGRSPRHASASGRRSKDGARDRSRERYKASKSAARSPVPALDTPFQPAAVRGSRSAGAVAAAPAAAAASKSRKELRPEWRASTSGGSSEGGAAGDSDASTARGSGSSGSDVARQRVVRHGGMGHSSSGGALTGGSASVAGEAASSASSSQAGGSSVARTEITLSPRPEQLVRTGSGSKPGSRRTSPDAVTLLPPPVPEEADLPSSGRSGREAAALASIAGPATVALGLAGNAGAAAGLAAIAEPPAGTAASSLSPESTAAADKTPVLSLKPRSSTSENDKLDYKHPAVVVEEYAPVSSARAKFNKPDDKPLTPRNSWGGGSGGREPSSSSRGGSGQKSSGPTPRSGQKSNGPTPRSGSPSPATTRSPRNPSAVAADSLLAEASATLSSVHEMAGRTPRTPGGRLLSSRSMPAPPAQPASPGARPPSPGGRSVTDQPLPERPASLRGAAPPSGLRSVLSNPAAAAAALSEPLPPRPASSAGGSPKRLSPAGGNSPMGGRASPAAGGSPMARRASASPTFGTAASAEALLDGIRSLAADVEASEKASAEPPAVPDSPGPQPKARATRTRSSRFTDWEARTSQRPDNVPPLGIGGGAARRRGSGGDGSPGAAAAAASAGSGDAAAGKQFETLETLRTKFAGR